MKLCPKCGGGLWTYDHQTLTCKNGHHHPTDATGEVVHPRRTHLLASAISGGAVALLIELIPHLL